MVRPRCRLDQFLARWAGERPAPDRQVWSLVPVAFPLLQCAQRRFVARECTERQLHTALSGIAKWRCHTYLADPEYGADFIVRWIGFLHDAAIDREGDRPAAKNEDKITLSCLVVDNAD